MRLPHRIRNERLACDAVARVIEDRFHARRQNERAPERDRTGPPIDFAFSIQGREYAIEHTEIEAFEGQIRAGTDFETFAEPIQLRLDRSLPTPGTYHLDFPIDPTAGIRRPDHSRVQDQICRWAQEAAAELCGLEPLRKSRLEAPRGQHGRRERTFQGVRVVLRREVHWALNERFDGRVFAGRYAPQELDRLREERIQRAVDKKIAQLATSKRDGAVTVLILENRDIAVTNHIIVGDVLAELLRNRTEIPDEVFFVDAALETWTVMSMFRDGILWPDEETDRRYHEFNPASLNEV